MNKFQKSRGPVLSFVAFILCAGCGKKAEEAAPAEETAMPAEAAEAAAPADDLRGAFEAKAAEVDAYRKGHDVTNTPHEELAATFEGFQKDFEDLAARAGGGEELAGRCRLAAEAMALHVEGLRTPPGDPSSLELAIDAEAKWDRARRGAAGGP
ncbi:MAG: hypothetical protein GTN49_12540 [candidate division Zixibacteria bacterium]|nr:hypothetical protein [candidate division Zixibacteria bacterium]